MTYQLKQSAAVVALVAGLFAFFGADAATRAEPALQQPAPPLTVTAVDGREIDLASLRGRVVLLNFWATWCAPCIAEMPALAEFYVQHRGEGFEVIALSVDTPQDRRKMRRLLATLPYPGAFARDASRNGFGIPDAVPQSYLIDRRGVVRDMFIQIDRELLDEAVLPLLKDGRRKGDG